MTHRIHAGRDVRQGQGTSLRGASRRSNRPNAPRWAWEFRGKPAGCSREAAGFSRRLAGFSREAAGFSRGLAGFSRGLAGFSRGLAGFSREAAGFSPGLAGCSRRVRGFSREVAGFSRGLAVFSRGFAGFSRGLAGFSRGLAGFSRGVRGYTPIPHLALFFAPHGGGLFTANTLAPSGRFQARFWHGYDSGQSAAPPHSSRSRAAFLSEAAVSLR
jgi:ATP-dependent DNA helicase Q1